MVRVFRNNHYEYISLEEYVEIYHNSLNQSWFRYMDLIDEGMSLDEGNYKSFIEKMNLKRYDSSFVCRKYDSLKNSEISQYFDNEVLKFLSHLYELGYFKRIGNPSLLEWISTKNVFSPKANLVKEDEGYSILDLVPIRNGDIAIKNTLLNALKW